MGTFLNFTLFGSGIGFFIALGVLLFIIIYSELEENGGLAGSFICIFLVLNYFWGNLPFLEIFSVLNVGLYLIFGFLFALIRTYFKGRELDESQKKFFKLKDHVFRWWFLFPFALSNWIIGKLLKDFYNFLYSKVSKFFEYIFNLK